MTRTIEMETKFTGEYGDDYEIRFDRDSIWIQNHGPYVCVRYEEFEKIVADFANFKKLNDSVKEAAQ